MTADLEYLTELAASVGNIGCYTQANKIREAVAELSAIRDAQVGADVGAVGYINLYRDEQGHLSAGTVDLYDSAEEANDFSAADFEEHAGVFALVPVTVGARDGAGEDQAKPAA